MVVLSPSARWHIDPVNECLLSRRVSSLIIPPVWPSHPFSAAFLWFSSQNDDRRTDSSSNWAFVFSYQKVQAEAKSEHPIL